MTPNRAIRTRSGGACARTCSITHVGHGTCPRSSSSRSFTCWKGFTSARPSRIAHAQAAAAALDAAEHVPTAGGAHRGRGNRGRGRIEGSAASCASGGRSRNRILESMQGPSATAAAPRSEPPVPIGASWMEKTMKSSYLMFTGYNTWANGRLYDRSLMFTVLREGN